MNHNILEIKNFSIGYKKNTPILKDISLAIPKQVRCAIIGLNGSGKTTFLKGILGLEGIISGVIKFFGLPIQEVTKKISYVPQIKTIDWSFPITIFDVIKMGCYNMEAFFSISLDKDYQDKVTYALSKMNLTKKKDNQINNLSGGEKQRVFIARAIAQSPELYIFDEPLTGLDMVSEQIISTMFHDITEKEGKTILAVHHDLHTLYTYFNWVIIVNQGITYYGPLEKEITDPLIREAFSRY